MFPTILFDTKEFIPAFVLSQQEVPNKFECIFYEIYMVIYLKNNMCVMGKWKDVVFAVEVRTKCFSVSNA